LWLVRNTRRVVTESREEEGCRRLRAGEARSGGGGGRRGAGSEGGAVVAEEEGGGALPHGGPVRQRRHERAVEMVVTHRIRPTWVFSAYRPPVWGDPLVV
jgi:hypothetical protein